MQHDKIELFKTFENIPIFSVIDYLKRDKFSAILPVSVNCPVHASTAVVAPAAYQRTKEIKNCFAVTKTQYFVLAFWDLPHFRQLAVQPLGRVFHGDSSAVRWQVELVAGHHDWQHLVVLALFPHLLEVALDRLE